MIQLWEPYLERVHWRASTVHIVPGQAIGIDRIESLNLGFHCGDKGRPGRMEQMVIQQESRVYGVSGMSLKSYLERYRLMVAIGYVVLRQSRRGWVEWSCQ